MIQIPTLLGNDSEVKRQEIKTYFQKTYKLYESLFSLVSDEKAYFQKADPLRHPIIFYYGHTATFFINKLKLAKIIDERIDPKLESIFAVGVDEMSWDDLNEKHYNWPTLEETQTYRDKVYDLVSDLIDTLPLELPITWKSPWWVILMGIEHENIPGRAERPRDWPQGRCGPGRRAPSPGPRGGPPPGGCRTRPDPWRGRSQPASPARAA